MKKMIIIAIISIIFLQVPVSADGGIFIDIEEHVFIPSQKAAIFWNGTNETMILSTKMSTKDIAEIAWIIPIQSQTKPEVEKGDIEIFYELAELFTPQNIYKEKESTFFDITSGHNELEIIESKNVDIYDITILKATNSTIMTKWLEKNGYKIPNISTPILQKYCNKNNTWFIATKINFSNKFENYTSPLGTKDSCKLHQFLDSFNSNADQLTESVSEIICSNYTEDIQIYEILNITSIRDYENIRNTYNPKKEDLEILCNQEYSNRPLIYYLLDRSLYLAKEGPITLSIEKNIDPPGNDAGQFILSSCSFPIENSTARIGHYCIYINEEWFPKVKIDHNNLKEIINRNKDYLIELKNTTYKSIKKTHKIIEKYKFKEQEKCAMLYNLDQGISSPLKFTFQPDQPFYPMEISSINEGYSNISVYVFSRTPVKDKSQLLKIHQMANNSYYLVDYLKEKYNLKNESYVTFLKYSGDLKKLDKDSIFTPTEYNSSLSADKMNTNISIINVDKYINTALTLLSFIILYILNKIRKYNNTNK